MVADGSGAVAGGDDATGGEGDDRRAGAEPVADEEATGAGWHGWLLVGVLVLSLLVVPALIVLRPPRLPFEAAFLALPMVPAVLLGATAVWAAVRAREG